ncbi:14905_t:CDS:2 [Funneliformis mosseae]|uniref:UDP-N-acetylglucosamine transferase subunit ALG13 n=1 Tax=Funneliformis mosseae TaxID=27381 RepID=A0A9N9BFE6_FUNMO|nr:14905_t:CDS:2 [Funneliformis mosseae]
MSENGKIIFVTVGSTGFDQIVQLITSTSCLQLLNSQGFTKLIVQYGKSQNAFNDSIQTRKNRTNEIDIIGYDFKPSLSEDMKNADLIICHAVVNENLMDNHQMELAIELQNKGYLVYSSISDLLKVLNSCTYEHLIPFPEPDKSLFANVLSEL